MNMPAMNTLQLLPCTPTLRAMHSVTDGQTDDRMMPIAGQRVAVQLAKNENVNFNL